MQLQRGGGNNARGERDGGMQMQTAMEMGEKAEGL